MTAARTAGADAAAVGAGKPVGTDAAVGVVGGAGADDAAEIGRLLERCAFPEPPASISCGLSGGPDSTGSPSRAHRAWVS